VILLVPRKNPSAKIADPDSSESSQALTTFRCVSHVLPVGFLRLPAPTANMVVFYVPLAFRIATMAQHFAFHAYLAKCQAKPGLNVLTARREE
jgi:hypothetical protein